MLELFGDDPALVQLAGVNTVCVALPSDEHQAYFIHFLEIPHSENQSP